MPTHPSKEQKPRVCFLRGSYLSQFETQPLVPLQDRFDIVLAHPRYHRYDLSRVDMPRVVLPCLDYLNGTVPRRLAGRTIPNPLKYFGYEEVLFGLDDLLPNFDIVHVPEQSFYFTWQVAKNKKKFGYKMVTMQDEVNPYCYTHKPPVAGRAALVRAETDLFVAASERAKGALMCEGVSPAKIRVIGDGVDTTRFYPASRSQDVCHQLGIDPGRFIILFVGRLVWTKGIFALADAAKLLLTVPHIKQLDPLFLIVGDGDERAAFEARLELLDLSGSFKLVGNQPYDLMPDLHRLADIFVLPSISTRYILEQNPYVLMESMACGKPVISTYCGAIDEIVEDAGLLVQANDYFQLFRAMSQLCLSAELRHEFGRRALARAKECYSSAVVSSALGTAYEKVLGQPQTSKENNR